MIDWNRVRSLRDDIGAEEFDEIVEIFLEEIDETVVDLEKTPQGELEHRLHFLKNGALNLGFHILSDLCLRGEKAAAAGNTSTIDIPEIVKAYWTARSSFLAELPAELAA